MKNHLFRDRAPITEAGWEEIEKEAKRTLRGMLAARRVVEFRGPLGWDDSDVELGRADRPRYPDAVADAQGDPDAASDGDAQADADPDDRPDDDAHADPDRPDPES